MSAGTAMGGRPIHLSEGGFSLIELVVVVGIAAIVMAVLTLGIRQASESFTLRRAANLAVNELRRAQATAMAQDVNYTVEFYIASGSGDPGGVRVWKAGVGSAVRSVVTPDWPSMVGMPSDGSTFAACPVAIDPNHDCVVFTPLGYPVADGAVTLRTSASGTELTIVVEPATGRVKVVR